jgi:hypothetical protein
MVFHDKSNAMFLPSFWSEGCFACFVGPSQGKRGVSCMAGSVGSGGGLLSPTVMGMRGQALGIGLVRVFIGFKEYLAGPYYRLVFPDALDILVMVSKQ